MPQIDVTSVRSICNKPEWWQVDTFWNPSDSFLLWLIGKHRGRPLVRTTGDEIEALKAKANAVHIAALNLSNTLGVFHGINNALEAGALGGPEIRAINVIQSDLLHLLVIRVCALVASVQNRPDDASIQGLVNALEDKGIREKLIEADERWRAATSLRLRLG